LNAHTHTISHINHKTLEYIAYPYGIGCTDAVDRYLCMMNSSSVVNTN
jgi:hypothetical protein